MTTLTIYHIRILNTQWCGIIDLHSVHGMVRCGDRHSLEKHHLSGTTTCTIQPPLHPIIIVTDLTELWQRKEKNEVKGPYRMVSNDKTYYIIALYSFKKAEFDTLAY